MDNSRNMPKICWVDKKLIIFLFKHLKAWNSKHLKNTIIETRFCGKIIKKHNLDNAVTVWISKMGSFCYTIILLLVGLRCNWVNHVHKKNKSFWPDVAQKGKKSRYG